MNICAREGCGKTYTKKTHNMKYCTDECCRLATNSRIMVDYYKNRDRKQGVVRWCSVCETTKLSRYNRSEICNGCKAKRVTEANSAVANMLKNAQLVS